MKFVKFSILALALGVFATSCSETKTEENTTVNTDTTVVAPVDATVVTDTVMAAPATTTTTTTTDSMTTTTPAGATHMNEGHTTTTHSTEVKK